MPAGGLFAFLLFLSVVFAGITSQTNMLEAVSEAGQSRLKLGRKAAVPISYAVTLSAGLFIEYEPYLGRWMDIITI